jgi:hypothetical protein
VHIVADLLKGSWNLESLGLVTTGMKFDGAEELGGKSGRRPPCNHSSDHVAPADAAAAAIYAPLLSKGSVQSMSSWWALNSSRKESSVTCWPKRSRSAIASLL